MPDAPEYPLLRVKDARKHFVGGGEFSRTAVVRALNGVDLDVRESEVVCVVGESGCGKSTLARVIAGLHKPSGGEVHFDGVRIDHLSARKRRRFCRDLQMIFQNPQGALNPRMKIGAMLAEALRFHFPQERGWREKSAATLEATGLAADALERYPHQFSGGQRQRISIARALIVAPRFIIADEPVAALDISVQAQILNLLAELRRARRLAYLFITHDLAVVEHFADRAAVMYLGRVCELSPAAPLFARPRHPYTRILLDAAPAAGKPLRAAKLPGEPPTPLNIPPGCPFHPRCPHADARCRREMPLLKTAGESQTACHAVEEGRI
ncbi:MAG: ABC transporter ATP-binding protein [Gammaproteobacteria bacterium]